MAETATLYLVFVEAFDEDALYAQFDAVCLRQGLFVIRSALDRSGLYHAVRDATRPVGLVVAPLAADPKFKGMAPGALKWVRARSIG